MDSEVLHHGRDFIDPAVIVLNELDLEATKRRDAFAKRRREVVVRDDHQGPVDDDRVELVEVQHPVPAQPARVEGPDEVTRMTP